MKKHLLFEVDCGEATCGKCDFHLNKSDECGLFLVYLVDGCVRDPMCLRAEKDAISWKGENA